MEKSVTLLFSINLGGFQARYTLDERADVVVDKSKAFIEGFFGNQVGEGSTFAAVSIPNEISSVGTVAYPTFDKLL